MVFDKDILDQTVLDAEARIVIINTKRVELLEILDVLKSIQEEEVIREVDGKPTRVKIEKKDRRTRKPFTPATLNVIFDDNVPLAQEKIIETI